MRSVLYVAIFLMLSLQLQGQTITIGTDTTVTLSTAQHGIYSQYYMSHRVQHLYTAEELIAAGAPAGGGFISAIAFHCATPPNESLTDWSIKIASTNASSMATGLPITDFLNDVYYQPSTSPMANAWNPYLIAPYWWNGTDNIVVDVCNTPSNTFSASGTNYFSYTDSVMTRFIAADNQTVCGVNTTVTHHQRANIQFTFGDTAAVIIQGSVYFDQNQNSQLDTGETKIAGQKISYPWNTYTQYVFTDDSGDYEIVLYPDTVSLTFVPDPLYQSGWANTGANPITVEAPTAGTVYSNNDFGVYVDPDYHDAGVQIFCENPVPGFSRYVYITAYNAGPNPDSVTVTFAYDALLHYTSTDSSSADANPDVDTVNRIVTYHFSLNAAQTETIDLKLYCAGGTALDLTAHNSVNVSINGFADNNSVNDSAACQTVVVGAFDPNDKQVNPAGQGNQHAINTDLAEQLLYTVRFQNTGTYPATNVVILDTLDAAALDVSSLAFVNSSHPCSVELINGNVLRASFIGIMLPDSGSNEPASHGYVTFRIGLVEGLNEGSVVSNRAAIYFDFNEPVITNDAWITLDASVAVNTTVANYLELYPNPVESTLTVFGHEHLTSLRYIIKDPMGKVAQHGVIKNPLDVTALSAGLYVLTVIGENGLVESKRFVVIKP